MATELKKVKREYDSNESALASRLVAGQWGQAQDTGALIVIRRDGVTVDAFDSRNRLAGQTSTSGTTLLGSQGIAGITPNGGTSGAAATLHNMLLGFRDSVILKAPYSLSMNTIQATSAAYTPLILKGNASQTVNLFELQNSSSTVISRYDSSGNFYLSRSAASASVSFVVQNLDNTSSTSDAYQLMSVGGGSAGDPYIRFNINGVGDWTVGSDNSDSDAFKVSRASSLGTNDYFSIQTSGAAALTSTLAVTGLLTASSGIAIGGGTGAAGRIYSTSNVGLVLWPNSGAATYDFVIANGAGADVMRAAPGTTTAIFPGTGISVSGTAGITGLLTATAGVSVPDATGLVSTISASTRTLMARSGTTLNIGENGGWTGVSYRTTSGTHDFTIGGTSRFTVGAGGGTVDGGMVFTGTGSAADAKIFVDAGSGMSMRGKAGSSYDMAFYTPAGSVFLRNPTGTSTADFPGAVTVTGTTTSTGNLTVSRSSSAGQVIATVANTSNTSSSDAKLLVQTAGSSGGYPYIHFQAASANDWSIGFTPTAPSGFSANAFIIANTTGLGSSIKFGIDTDGKTTVNGSLVCNGGTGTYLKVPSGTSDPASVEGAIYYNSISAHIYARAAGSWIQIA